MTNIFWCYAIMMLIFDETKVAKETFYRAKNPINIWDINVDNIVMLKYLEQKYFLSIWIDI